MPEDRLSDRERAEARFEKFLGGDVPADEAEAERAFCFELMRRASLMRDPNGLDPHTPGAKLDAGKLDLTLVPPALIEAVAEVMVGGVVKYSRHGWAQVPEGGRRYAAALLRHLHAWLQGEDVDGDSGLHHLKHAATNIAFLLAFLAAGRDVGDWRLKLDGEVRE